MKPRITHTLTFMVVAALAPSSVANGQAAASRDADAVAQVERLVGALRIPTVSNRDPKAIDGAPFRALHEYFKSAFPKTHETLLRETQSEFSLLYTWRGSDPDLAPLLLLAHIDVVAADSSPTGGWTHPPFGAVIADGFVWARGALDDKSSAVAQLEAIESLIEAGFRPRRTIYIAFGHDEEYGGREGAAMIAQRLLRDGVRPALVLDEGGKVALGIVRGIERPVALVGVAEKGNINVELSAVGPEGSTLMPPSQTTVGILANAVARLEATPFPPRLSTPVRAMYDVLAPYMTSDRLLAANLWIGESIFANRLSRDRVHNASVRTTTAATVFAGSHRPNVLPAHASTVINFRALPGDSIEVIVDHVRRTIADDRVTIKVMDISRDPSPVSPMSGPAFDVLRETIHETIARDLPIAPYLIIGGTDARHYAVLTPNVYRFQPLRLSQQDVDRMHSVDERIAVNNYVELVGFYERFIRNADATLQ